MKYLVIFIKTGIVACQAVFLLPDILPGLFEADLQKIQRGEITYMFSARIYESVSIDETHESAHITSDIFISSGRRIIPVKPLLGVRDRPIEGVMIGGI